MDLDEEVVLAIEMEWRGRVRRGDENETFELLEAGIAQAVEAAGACNRQQRVLDQPAVLRRILDPLQHHPGASGLDPLHYLDRIEIDGGNRIGVLADGDLAGIVFDQVAGQFGGELRDARQRQQRMTRQLVADRKRPEREIAAQGVVGRGDRRRRFRDGVHAWFS